jgi:hypothetical protein
VGAQFVASLDARVQGSLTSELVPGSSALFATVSKESGRPILLRTGPILRVQYRNAESESSVAPLPGVKVSAEVTAEAAAPTAAVADKSSQPRPRKKGETRRPPPMPKEATQSVDSVSTQPKGLGKWIAPTRDSAPTTRRRIEQDESSITLVTYPGVPVRGSTARKEPAAHPKSTAEEAVPLLLKKKKKS